MADDLKVIDFQSIEDVVLDTAVNTPEWNVASTGNVAGITSPSINATSSVFNIPTSPTPTPDLLWWSTDIVRSSTDYNTVAWTSGSIKLADWTSYTVNAWNTGNISAVTYIYYDWTTTLKTTTTAATSVWTNKILLCVAKNVSDTTWLAQFQAFGTLGQGIFITADNIAANTITANEIATNTITTSQLSATAIDGMTITGALIRTAASGVRSQLSTNYFSSFDANYERIRLWDSGYKLQFWDASGNDWWYISWTYNSTLNAGIVKTSWPFWSGWQLILWSSIIWVPYPYLDATYSLWTSSNQWSSLYIENYIYFTSNWASSDWILNCSFGYPTRRALGSAAWYMTYRDWDPALSGRYVASSSWWSPTTQLWYMPINIWWTVYKFLYSWII